MLSIQNLSYCHPDQELLFSNLHFTIANSAKVAFVGNNGAGKSTLIKLIAGELQPSAGFIMASSAPWSIPQDYGQYNHLTIAQALGIAGKLQALEEILAGNVKEKNYAILNDDWSIEERCHAALKSWHLENLLLTQLMGTLSGGQKTKIFLAGITIHQPAIILMDEPSNHLDTFARQLLYNFIQSASAALLIVSHDRKLLNLAGTIYELNKHGITAYGGNYDFYATQKKGESEALNNELRSREKALRKARETAREATVRQQKLDARGKKKQEKAGLPTISMNTFKNNAEKSTSRMKSVHAEKVATIFQELDTLRKELPEADKMKFGFADTTLHNGKILVAANDINYAYNGRAVWKNRLSFQVTSGERISLAGLNGSGKTTLVKLILGNLTPVMGTITVSYGNAVYIDQEYALINNSLTVYEQAQLFNNTALPEHELKIRLNRFLFAKDDWDKPCLALSGGERMRLALCCLTTGSIAPDIIVLDEPTNNLDIRNIEILTAAITEYAGTLIVISHDAFFLEQVMIRRTISLS